eukprot:CAMPEP_0176024588 /NCGR_PEP_ID=MMETSP0120_2-20121206/12017_1 /TAXON_ID=160619 /ORGANISM="Kryptoperidinium foliaceum, Strain CCMP 1326" /LENGTH=207 /DNA_ID=CAMNT_0017357767 /DNA_START=47 /DNA_END=668 /DNA_ORIENTATION=-
MGNKCCVDLKSLPYGCDDNPGYASLPHFSPWLFVGNRFAPCFGDFDVVISTVMPVDEGGDRCTELSTYQFMFQDCQGRERASQVERARKRIVAAAAVVAASTDDKKSTLVHCEWGQNRSCTVCCAYAVLYLGWEANAAIAYVRSQNYRERAYLGQSPMCNRAFNKILQELEKYGITSSCDSTVRHTRSLGAARMTRFTRANVGSGQR